jgi:hypothetical protein
MISIDPTSGDNMHRLIWAFLLPLSMSAVAADKGTELQSLYNALSMLNQEQQAIYQQFQMVQELRRNNALTLYGAQIPPPTAGEIPNYDEQVAAQRSAVRRAESLHLQADQLLARFNEIEAMKQPLQQQIYGLTLSR